MPCLLQPVLGSAGDDLDLVVEVGDKGVTQGDLLGHALHQSDHVDRERGLQLSELEQVVHHHVGVAVAFEADDQLGLAAVGAIVDIGNTVEVAVVDQLLDTRSNRRAGGLVRQLSNNDFVSPILAFFNRCLGTRFDRAAAGAIRVHDPSPTENLATGREVRTLDELHERVRIGVGIVNEVHDGVDYLAEVVWRDVRCHTNSDALAAIDQQVREPRWKHNGFLGGPVVVRDHVDGVFVDASKQFHRERVKATLGITRGGRTEVG